MDRYPRTPHGAAIWRYLEREYVADAAHGLDHLRRVMGLAHRLAAAEGGDRQIIEAAALLHDIHRALEFRTGDRTRATDGFEEVQRVLAQTSFPATKRSAILHCIEMTDRYSFAVGGLPDRLTLEAKIVRDADNLDALGAIGIARLFAFSAEHNVPLFAEGEIEVRQYEPGTQSPSAIGHANTKLLRLKDDFSTVTAARLGAERHDELARILTHIRDEASLALSNGGDESPMQ